MKKSDEEIIKNFFDLYVGNGALLHNTVWMGVPALKIPFDLWMYQEMMWTFKPDFIVETGTFGGGSALFMAGVYDQLAMFTPVNGKIITIDIWPDSETACKARPHPRVEFILGSSISNEIFQAVKNRTSGKNVMVVLDSAHDTVHVLKELELYSTLVKPGGYLIVEDTTVEGPRIAVEQWLPNNPNFIVDSDKHEKFFLSCNPGGYLKRIA